jgi:hypothetical protein
LGDFHESPSPTLLVSVEPPAVWDAVGMRGRLWMARGAINLHHAFDADFYWVGFSCFALRATQDKPATVEVRARREAETLRSA